MAELFPAIARAKPYQTVSCGTLRMNDAEIEIIDLLKEKPGASGCPPHLHTWFEFNYVFEGKMAISYGDGMLEVQAGEYFLLPPGTEHAHEYTLEQPHLGVCMRWTLQQASQEAASASTQSTYEQLSDLCHWQPGIYTDNANLGKHIDACFEAAERKGSSLSSLLPVIQVLVALTEYLPERERWIDMEPDSSAALLRKVEIYLNDDSGYEVDVHQLAASLHMSYGHLARKYKRLTGQTVLERMNEIRLERSLEMLRLTDKPIQDIAEKAGFSSLSYYSRMFKQHYGFSPREYRESSLKVNPL